MFGVLEVEGLAGADLGSRKARTLVKVLALARGATVPADAVVEALWPGDDMPAKPVEQVGVLISRLRSVLGADRLRRSGGGWALAVDWLDVAEFEARVDEAAARVAAGSPAGARAAAQAALTLVRGELLADEPDALWAEPARAVVARTVARARLIGTEAALAAGDYGDAAALAEGLLDHDPYDETALRVLMRSHTAAGRPASALAAYARVRERLSEDLGVDPAEETEALHTAILLGDRFLPGPVPQVPALSPRLVGRDSHLAALDGLLARARTGDCSIAVVEGEAGIGKTVLMSHWANAVRSEALVVSGRCDELGRDLPLQPVIDGLAAYLRSLDPSEVESLLGEAGPVLGPLLGRSSIGAHETGPVVMADPVAGLASLFTSLLATIDRAAGGRVVVVIVEDAHLAGATTIEWLRFAVRRGPRLLVVATRRPEGPALGPTELLSIGPLDLASVTELVGEQRAPELYARSGGHPLFLQELAASTSAELPNSVREAVATRVDNLGAAASTLRAAAVLGPEVDVDLLAGVLDVPVPVLLDHLDSGMRALILQERSAGFAFRHELVREALLAGTTAARRAYIHREAARVLSGRPAHDPMDVAWHARSGGDIPTAIVALVDAAAAARKRYDTVLAEQLLTDAISLEDSAVARAARARVRIDRFDLDGAEADAARSLELGGGPGSLELAGWAAYYKRHYQLALDRAEEAAERTDDPGVRARCLVLSGRILHASGRLAEADQRLSNAVAGAPIDVRGIAQVYLGGLRVHQGRVGDSAQLVDRALLDPDRLGGPFALHHAHLFRALALGMRGNAVQALAAVEIGAAVASQSGEPGRRFIVVQDNLRSWVLRALGRLDEADEVTHRALEVSGRHRSSMNEMYLAARLDLIEGRLLAGDLDAAGEAIQETGADLGAWNGTHAWHHHQRFLSLSARYALAMGDPDEAASVASRVVADAAERGARRYGLFAHVELGRARIGSGEAIDYAALDGVLAELEQCAGLEAWRLTAELASAAGVDRWWRSAELRAGALVARSGEHGEALRQWVARTFAALGR